MTGPTFGEGIPTSAAAFRVSGGSERFASWLHAVRGELPFARCQEIAGLAGQVIDVLNAAAPHVIARDPAAAEAFRDQADLPLLGIASERRVKLKRAVRGLNAWVRGFDGPTTRAVMDRGVVGSTRPTGAVLDAIVVPDAGSDDCQTAAGRAAHRRTAREGPAQIPDGVTTGRVELPLSYNVFETAVSGELARRVAAKEPADAREAARAVLVRHAPITRRRLALAAAAPCALPATTFVRAGALSTAACEAFLVRLVEVRRRAGWVTLQAA